MNIGAEIDVKESDGKVYQATVLKMESSKCLVHFKGWASSWDEWLDIPEQSESIEKEGKTKEKVLSQKAPVKSDKRKHSSSYSASSSSSPNQNEPPIKKLKPEVVSEIDISKDAQVSMSTPLNHSLDESLVKSATSSGISETPSQEQTKSTPTEASSSKASPVQKTSSKKAPTPDERQKTILSFFKKFDPAARKSPQLKPKKSAKQVEEVSDEVKILEKVSPKKILEQKSGEKELTKKVDVVSSSLGFFKLAEEETKHKEVERTAKFTCQHCKMTFSNMLTWKSHEDGHVQVKIKTFLNF